MRTTVSVSLDKTFYNKDTKITKKFISPLPSAARYYSIRAILRPEH
jgi:hypothetical protein